MATPPNEDSFFYSLAIFGWACALIFGVVSIWVEAPYGKLATGQYMKVGPLRIPEIPINPRLGWFLMELPSTLSFIFTYPWGKNSDKPLPLFLASLFLIHYANRGFYFPYNIRVAPGQTQNFSIIIVLVGWFVTSMHGYMSARWYSDVNQSLATAPWEFVTRPYFIAGLAVYEFGFINMLYSEHIIRNLRTNKPGEPRYKIPRGGAFEYVTNAPYLFELTAWFGFALMTLNPGGVLVFLMSCANLVPRAFHTHAWYKKTFGDDYPKERRVLIPFLL
jgi:3-oxo-5-alpha-steroid 4-dehydrogenase 1